MLVLPTAIDMIVDNISIRYVITSIDRSITSSKPATERHRGDKIHDIHDMP